LTFCWHADLAVISEDLEIPDELPESGALERMSEKSEMLYISEMSTIKGRVLVTCYTQDLEKTKGSALLVIIDNRTVSGKRLRKSPE
jgi:hypothetical protein